MSNSSASETNEPNKKYDIEDILFMMTSSNRQLEISFDPTTEETKIAEDIYNEKFDDFRKKQYKGQVTEVDLLETYYVARDRYTNHSGYDRATFQSDIEYLTVSTLTQETKDRDKAIILKGIVKTIEEHAEGTIARVEFNQCRKSLTNSRKPVTQETLEKFETCMDDVLKNNAMKADEIDKALIFFSTNNVPKELAQERNIITKRCEDKLQEFAHGRVKAEFPDALTPSN